MAMVTNKMNKVSLLAGNQQEYHELSRDVCNLALNHLTKIQLVCVQGSNSPNSNNKDRHMNILVSF